MAQVTVPAGEALVAFYLDQTFTVVAAEFLPPPGISRQIQGVSHKHDRPTIRTPQFDATRVNRVPDITVPTNNALVALYMDADSRIVALESIQPGTVRKVKDLGIPIPGGGPCPTRCTVYGPNGAYCLPGCK